MDNLSAKLQLRILMSLRRIIRAVDIHSRHLRNTYQITGPQLICLLTIAKKGSITSSELSREIHLSKSTLVGIIDRLENKGLISRERNSRDRRQVALVATEKGYELSAKAPSPLQDKFAEALSGLPEPEQNTIASSMDKIVKLMEVGHLEAAPFLAANQEIGRDN